MVTAASFSCPSCGGSLSIRAPGQSETIACQYCGSLLDPRDPAHLLLEKCIAAIYQPAIPIGSRGKLRGDEFEVIGHMRRATKYDGVFYAWSEYLLFNPYKGYRWLTEYAGHWNLLKPLPQPPAERA